MSTFEKEFEETMSDTVIVGGGIIGLLTARYLAQAGKKVTLIDKSELGSGATWASAGIISPHATSGSTDIAGEPGLILRNLSFALWPQIAQSIQQETGIDIEFTLSGVLLVSFNKTESENIKTKAKKNDWGNTNWLSSDEVQEKEPELSKTIDGALLVEGGNVEVRNLGPALEISCRKLGVEIRSGELVYEVISDKNSIVGIRTEKDEINSSNVIICAGTGSNKIKGINLEVPILPQKGQIISIDGRKINLNHIILTENDPYFVPRSNGKIILGATREWAGEDKRLTVGGLNWLMNGGMEIIPNIKDSAIKETWTGFRPVTTDYLPLIGKGNIDGLFFCSGHGPSGVGPAPASAKIILSLLTEKTPEINISPYNPIRFQEKNIN